MSPEESNQNEIDEVEELTELEEELLSVPEKKSSLQIFRIVLGISLFFGGFNLTILYDSLFINIYLCSPAAFNCNPELATDVATTMATQVFSILKVLMISVFMVSLIVGGAISDDLRSKFGPRLPMILIGAVISGVGYMIFPILVRGNNFELFIILGGLIYVFIYIGLGFALAPEYALISELFTKEERGWAGLGFAGVGLVGTLFGVILQATFIDPFTKGVNPTPELIPWNTLGLVAGLFIIFMGVLTVLLTPKKNPPFPSDGVVQDILNTPKYLFQLGSGNDANKDFLLMFIVGILWGGGGFIINSYLPNLLLKLGNTTRPGTMDPYTTIDVVVLLIVMGISGAVFAGPIGVLIAKLGKVKSGMVGSLILGFFSFTIAQSFAWNDPVIVLLAITAGFGTIFITAVNISLPADLVPKGKEGQFMGLFIVAANLSAPVVGVIAAFILTSADPETGAILALSTIFLMTTALFFGAIFILGFMHYESQIEGEYQLFYRRYLIAKGYISDKAKYTALKVSSSLRIKR